MNSDEGEAEQLGSVTQFECNSPGVGVRTSARVSKKLKQDSLVHALPAQVSNETAFESKKVGKEDSEVSNIITKTKKNSWIPQDKDTFFEALNECGKDFDAMYKYFIQKSKKKGITGTNKSKSQIRCFYYRTWSKISKYIRFPADIKKQAQELYGLINYGELRKKVGFVTEKMRLKLNELILRGFANVRLKGKTVHVRTPKCASLRKLYVLEDMHEGLDLPLKVYVDLTPRSNLVWVKLQAASQNPRIRICLPLQYRLSNLIQFLEKKWLTYSSKYNCKLLESGKAERLRLAPKSQIEIHISDFNIGHYFNNSRLCLSSYAERLGKQDACSEILKQVQAESKSKGKRHRTDSSSTVDKKDEDIKKESELKSKKTLDFEEAEFDYDYEEEKTPDEIPMFLKTFKKIQLKDEAIAKVRSGWNLNESESIAIGDLYLMFGCNSKIQLEYWFEDDVKTSPTQTKANVTQPTAMLSKLISIIKLYKTESRNVESRNRSVSRRTVTEDSSEDDNLGQASISTIGSSSLSRKPYILPAKPSTSQQRLDPQTYQAQLRKIMPRYCNRRGRTPSSKGVLTQRPILPRVDSSVMNFNVVPVDLLNSGAIIQSQIPNIIVTCSTDPPEITGDPLRASSPAPSLSTLLGIKEEHGNFLNNDPLSPTLSNNLKEEDWLTTEDYSLSSFLGHLEAVQETPPSDTKVQTLLNESTSADYMPTFSDLTENSR